MPEVFDKVLGKSGKLEVWEIVASILRSRVLELIPNFGAVVVSRRDLDLVTNEVLGSVAIATDKDTAEMHPLLVEPDIVEK